VRRARSRRARRWRDGPAGIATIARASLCSSRSRAGP
jgi:hypothetical protein